MLHHKPILQFWSNRSVLPILRRQMPRPKLILHNLNRTPIIKTWNRANNIHQTRPVEKKKINPVQAYFRRITQRHNLTTLIHWPSKIPWNTRLGQRLANSIMIPWNQNDLHMLWNLLDKLCSETILLVDIRNLQIHFLARIDSDPVHEITTDYYMLDTVSYLALAVITHV